MEQIEGEVLFQLYEACVRLEQASTKAEAEWGVHDARTLHIRGTVGVALEAYKFVNDVATGKVHL